MEPRAEIGADDVFGADDVCGAGGIPTRTILRYPAAADAWKALVEVYNSQFQAVEASNSVTIEPLGI